MTEIREQLTEIIEKKDLSKEKSAALRDLVLAAMQDAGDREFLFNQIKTKRLKKRGVVIPAILQFGEEALKSGSSELGLSVLKLVAQNAKNDESFKWKAFRLWLSQDELNAPPLFIESLKNIASMDLVGVLYQKLVQPSMGEDGGLAFLRLCLSCAECERHRPLIQGLIVKLNASAVRSAASSLPQQDSKVVEPQTRETRSESSPSTASEQMVNNPLTIARAEADRIRAGLSALTNALSDLLRSQMETTQEKERLLQNLRATNRQLAEMKEQLALEQQERRESSTVTDTLKQRIGALEQQVQEALRAKTRAEQELKEKTTAAKKAHDQAEQDIALIRNEAEGKLIAFKRSLWALLKPALADVRDRAITDEYLKQLPTGERIAVRQLHEIYEILRSEGVVLD